MKTSHTFLGALVILGVAATPLIAQTQTTTSSTNTAYVQTSKIVGTKVKASNGEEVGVVKDVILDRSNGCMAYTVLSAGGTGSRLTGGGKLVAVPWSVYTVSPDAGYLTVNVDRQRIYDAPVFEYSRMSDTTYTTNVFQHFGASAGVGVGYSGATSTTTGMSTTAGTTTQTQAGASAAPSASAAMSASPGASASPSASVSPSESASPAASASAEASASASPRSAPGGRIKAGASPSASPRHRSSETSREQTGSSEQGDTGSSSSSERKSTRKATGEESTSAETGESPSGKKSSHRKSKTEGAETTATPGGEQE